MTNSLFKYFNWFVYDSKILNWNHIDKCILILFFFVFTKVIWISWKLFTIANPQFYPFVHLGTLNFHLKIEIIQLICSIILIGLIFLKRKSKKAQEFFPYFCLVLLTTSLVFDWYSAGLLATGTVINSMSFIYLLIVLFDREYIVFTLIYSVGLSIFFLNSGIVNSDLKFPPLFNLTQIGYPNFKNQFWLWSTIYFSVPPFMVGLFILSTILRQWSARENYVTQLSQKDGLTAVYNRRVLNDFLMELDRDRSSNYPYAILLIDLDHFKSVNDTYGHLIGDRILIASAKLIQQNIRRTDILGRYGGEEFLIIIKETHPYEIRRLAERCRLALADYPHIINAQKTIIVTCSIGVAFSHANYSALQVLNEADQALYQAKTRGRNQVSIA